MVRLHFLPPAAHGSRRRRYGLHINREDRDGQRDSPPGYEASGAGLSHPGGVVHVRQARPDDEVALTKINAAAWREDVSPAPAPPPDAPFFGERTRPADTLAAEIDGVVVGYAVIGQSLPLASHAHVLELRGLAVDPARQRCGAGRRLVEASIEQARGRGARKLVLRVLGGNARARRLYESCGFGVEGVLHAEFFLAGQYVDDVLMARGLIAD
jgi:ribosomal protein S18 acetylase RimI-like enzyme